MKMYNLPESINKVMIANYTLVVKQGFPYVSIELK